MPEKEERVSNFLQAMNKYAQEQRAKIKTEIEEIKQKELEKAEVEILNDTYKLIQDEMLQMRRNIASEVSKKEMQGRTALFEKRAAITEKVFLAATERLLEFTKSPEYLDALEKYAKNIANVLKEPGTVLYVKKEDLAYESQIKKAFGAKDCTVQAADDIKIGGIRGYNLSMGLIADESLDSKLEEERKWFTENSGLRLS